jgi:catechol 2,3-dioxygenase
MSENIKKRTAAVTPKGFNHLVLNVRNMEESHRFWSDMLGFKQVGAGGSRPTDSGRPSMNMQFYSGVTDDLNHHDIALVEVADMPENPEWSLAGTHCAINHIAITYPDRESWLEQVKFLEDNDALTNPLRVDHGMTHSVYITDPNGYGVEVLYELPEEVWRHDIDGALNYAQRLPVEDLYTDTTEYETNFG